MYICRTGTVAPLYVCMCNAGTDVIDWLLSWSFAEDRSSAAALATDMLRNGFFHTINLDPTTNVLALSKDRVLSRNVVDNDDAKYVFVSQSGAGGGEGVRGEGVRLVRGEREMREVDWIGFKT